MNRLTLSRRELLKSAAATVVAAPYVISSAALGNDKTPAASERVTIGHIGVGTQGTWLAQCLLQCKGCQSIATSDVYKDRLRANIRMTKGKAYADFRDLLANKDIDAVLIATPDHWHVPIAIAAARAGKDVYVEKPLGVCLGEDLACLKVFQEHQQIFQYGTWQRSLSHCRLGRDIVRSGRIGKLQAIEVVAPAGGSGGSTKVIPVPKNLDYNMWCGPSPVRPYTADRCREPGTYWIYDYSIGYLGGWGAHPLDIMIWADDSDISGPMTVEGTGDIPTKGLYDTVYNWDMKIHFGNGIPMTFKTGGDSTKFIGSEGWVQISRGGLDASPKSLLPTWKNDVWVTPHMQNFIDCVKSRKSAIAPLDEAVRSDTISHLCNIAVRTKRKITWDPKTKTIVGDAEAAQMMHRTMRAPWTL
jgi:predicted dehydrogenase